MSIIYIHIFEESLNLLFDVYLSSVQQYDFNTHELTIFLSVRACRELESSGLYTTCA